MAKFDCNTCPTTSQGENMLWSILTSVIALSVWIGFKNLILNGYCGCKVERNFFKFEHYF